MSPVRKMWVSTVNKNGNDLGDGHWEDIPEPDSFASNGFAHIESHVSRLLDSPMSYSSVQITTPDGQAGILLYKRDGVPELALLIRLSMGKEKEQVIRLFFEERKLTTSLDYLPGNKFFQVTSRHLSYVLPRDVDFITSLAKDVLQVFFQLQEKDALNFTYEEDDG